MKNIFSKVARKLLFRVMNKSPNVSFTDFEKALEQYFYGKQTSTTVTEATAMKFGAVSTCVGIISQDIGLLPFELRKYREPKNPGAGSDPAFYHPLFYTLKNKSNNLMPAYNFKERLMSDLLLSGNFYAYKELNSKGQVISLMPLEWQNVELKEENNNIIYYYKENGKTPALRFIRDEVFHISGYGNGFIGQSPVSIKMQAIKSGLSSETFVNMFYEQGLNSGVAITLPARVKDKEGLRKELKEKYQGLANTGMPLVLEDGMTVQKLVMPLKEAEFIESKKFTARDIASWYRVPPKMIGDHEFSTYSNNEQQELDYVKHTLLPWTERLENFVNCFLLTPRNVQEGYFSQFDYNTLLKPDAQTRAEVNHIKRNDGVITANEWRASDGLNPRDEDEANILIINSNMKKIESVNDLENSSNTAQSGEGGKIIENKKQVLELRKK